MDEKQAWLEIWEAFRTPFRKQNDEQRRLTEHGLCCAVMRTYWHLDGVEMYSSKHCEGIPSDMFKKLEECEDGSFYDYPRHDRKNNPIRADFAYLMSLSCKES